MSDPSQNQDLQDQQDSSAENNPLSELEKLLESAKKRKAEAGVDAQAPGPVVEAAAEAVLVDQAHTEAEAARKAQEQAEYQQLSQQNEAADLEELEKQRQEIASIQSSPEYQARSEQQQEEASEEEQQKQQQDGYQIEQLKHTKV